MLVEFAAARGHRRACVREAAAVHEAECAPRRGRRSRRSGGVSARGYGDVNASSSHAGRSPSSGSGAACCCRTRSERSVSRRRLARLRWRMRRSTASFSSGPAPGPGLCRYSRLVTRTAAASPSSSCAAAGGGDEGGLLDILESMARSIRLLLESFVCE